MAFVAPTCEILSATHWPEPATAVSPTSAEKPLNPAPPPLSFKNIAPPLTLKVTTSEALAPVE